MNPLNGLKDSKGGRPAVLALVVLLQTSAAVFFVANVLAEWREDGLGPQLWIQSLVTLALILGQNAVDEVSGLHPLQRWILELHEPAVHSRHRGTTNSEMKVRSPHFQNLHQDVH